jgi:hypothetical protein
MTTRRTFLGKPSARAADTVAEVAQEIAGLPVAAAINPLSPAELPHTEHTA